MLTAKVLAVSIEIYILNYLCTCGRTTFLPALKFAREQGLFVTLHCGEVHLSFYCPYLLC